MIQNKERVRTVFDAINRQDIDAVMSLQTDDIDWWVIGRAKVSGHKSKRLVQITLKSIFRSFQAFQFTIHDMTAEENRVAVTAESRGLHRSGLEYNNHYHFLFFLRDGLIERVKEYFDTEHAMWLESASNQ